MGANTTKVDRTPKGSVALKNSHGRLQLVFNCDGTRYYLSTGLPDTSSNRKAIQGKVKLIESDIAYDRLDTTLAKYRPQKSADLQGLPQELPQLIDLWVAFTEFKQSQCSPSTMAYSYATFSRYVEKLPTQDLERSGEIFNWIVRNIPPDSAKRFVTRLSACCSWASQCGLMARNPFKGLASQVKMPKGSNDSEIDPFTAQERDRILNAVKTDAFVSKFSAVPHSHYWGYLFFAFFTGARTSEMIALQWRHIELEPELDNQTSYGRIRFEDAVVESGEGRVRKKGLKTQERRDFPINKQVYNFLKLIQPEAAKPNDLLFPGVGGGIMHPGNVARRVWKPVLEGLGIRYRKLYNTRHTFITLALNAGVPIPDIAKLVGNSPEVILSHYAGTNRVLNVPEL